MKKPVNEKMTDRRSEMGQIGGQQILFDNDYMGEE